MLGRNPSFSAQLVDLPAIADAVQSAVNLAIQKIAPVVAETCKIPEDAAAEALHDAAMMYWALGGASASDAGDA